MKAFVTLVCATVPEKDATLGPKLEFMIVVGAKVWPIGASKHTERVLGTLFVKKTFIRGFKIDNTTGK